MVLTWSIIAVTCIVSYLALQDHRLLHRLLLWPPAVTRDRQVERLVTYGLVHADFSHLLFNMITLYFFGAIMERLYTTIAGPLGFLLFYVCALIVSVLPSYFAHRRDPNYRCLGASGAVCAVLFAYILIQPWSIIYIYFIPVPAILYAIAYVVYSVVMDRRQADRTNHNAHLWGAAFGVVFTLALKPALFGLFMQRLLNP